MASNKRKGRRDRAFHRAPPGAPPGTLRGLADALPTTLGLMAYGEAQLVERSGAAEELAELLALGADQPVRWLDVVGLANTATLEAVAEHFGIHPLALEDVVHVHQRAKVESYDGHTFVTVRMVHRSPGGGGVESEQISLFIGKGWLLTFQERPGDVFAPARDRLRGGRSKIRTQGADYLAYVLLDAIVDAAFPVLESYDDALDRLEIRIVEGGDAGVVSALHRIRADLLQLRRAIWPLREAMAALVRDDAPEFSPGTRIYLRDCHDHAVQLLDVIESWREIAASLMDLHLSAVGQRTNEIMRLLTVISVLFMPMSFVTGLYGMNFDNGGGDAPWNMPELHWRFGYPFALLLMVMLAGGFFLFFRRKGFLRPIDGITTEPRQGHGHGLVDAGDEGGGSRRSR